MHPYTLAAVLYLLVALVAVLAALVAELLDKRANARELARDDEALALVARLQEVTR